MNKESVLVHNLSVEYLKQLFGELKGEIAEMKRDLEPRKPKDYLTRTEVCEMLQIDRSTLHIWCKKGKLQAYGIGNRIYFLRSELESAIQPLNKAEKRN